MWKVNKTKMKTHNIADEIIMISYFYNSWLWPSAGYLNAGKRSGFELYKELLLNANINPDDIY